MSLFDKKNIKKTQELDKTVDQIRAKYGTRVVTRGTFANGYVNPVQGGTNDSNFLMMGGYEHRDPHRAND